MSNSTSFIHPDGVASTARVEAVVTGGMVRLVLVGEADLLNLAELDAVTAAVDLPGAACVLLDLSALTFADVATIRRLVDFVRRAREAGCEVRTVGCSHDVRRLTGLLGADGDLALS